MEQYLQQSTTIDWGHPQILAKAEALRCLSGARSGTARNCFEFVRDEILHSGDHQAGPVTCRASEVLQAGTGFCFGKSHLLAALLRANGLHAGLCYQRLLIGEESGRFCLHGLNAVFLPAYGWYRVDPRGNKTGIACEFVPPQERLAYTPSQTGEQDLPEIYADPLPQVIEALEAHDTVVDLESCLPDV
ncbi:transglutaminase-like domain-containing protein [Microbulbifer celer]|uniref:Transglutaminase family protein n=1 Tax=Microbulbifer celer TaxID=435905 RepID=A0ABW3U2S8_9GAMM|nr:transglutaminase family protein [Microbulbifer celer]UFN56148.1 transglutaminase family protein [Microbulbifer celer]